MRRGRLGGEDAANTADVNELLTQTFTGDKKIDSGKVDASLRIDASGGSEGQQAVTMRLSGPFQTTGADTLPELQLAFGLDGGGQSIDAGVTSTGEKAYVAFQGEDYAVSDQVFNQFKSAYEQAAAKSKESGQGQSLTTLGMDPRKWLTDPRNAGEAKVGDDDTIKITGGVDVDALLDDVNTALGKVGELGLSGAGQVPDKITEAQKRQVIDAVKDPRVEIYTGKEDKILRRMVVDLGVEDAESKTSGKLARRHGHQRPQRGSEDHRALRRPAVQRAAGQARRRSAASPAAAGPAGQRQRSSSWAPARRRICRSTPTA